MKLPRTPKHTTMDVIKLQMNLLLVMMLFFLVVGIVMLNFHRYNESLKQQNEVLRFMQHERARSAVTDYLESIGRDSSQVNMRFDRGEIDGEDRFLVVLNG